MQFFRGKFALLAVLLAIFGQFAPVVARVCTMAQTPCALAPNSTQISATERIQCAPPVEPVVAAVSCCHPRVSSENVAAQTTRFACCEEQAVAFLASAPLLGSHSEDFAPRIAISSATPKFAAPLALFSRAQFAQLDLPPPLLGSLSSFSCRAPPTKI